MHRPECSDHALVRAGLLHGYGLDAVAISPLAGGADAGACAFAVRASGGVEHVLKIQGPGFAVASSQAASYLRYERGLLPVVAPLPTRDGQPFFRQQEAYWLLYEYRQGRNGFAAKLEPAHWRCLGQTLRAAHDAPLPHSLAKTLPKEDFSANTARQTERLLARALSAKADALERRFHACLTANRPEILEIIRRADTLRPAPGKARANFVLCHGDIHAGNVIVPGGAGPGTEPKAESGAKQTWAEGTNAAMELALVDWDSACLAPRERDLMFIGAGVGGAWNSEEDTTLFYQGYGPVVPDRELLCYYRHERILADIVELADMALAGARAPALREQALAHMQSQFLPGNVVAMADKTYANLGLILTLRREPSAAYGTFGRLAGQGLDLHTAELPWRDNATEISCIPEGEYLCRRCSSPRFGEVYEVTNVPGRTHILIHKGNWAGERNSAWRSDVLGCILLGLERGLLEGQPALLRSGAALEKFMQTMADRPFLLRIQNPPA